MILPLLEGGSSQSLNEALSSGLPVVTNFFPNILDYIKTEAVLSYPPKDFKKMASACLDILQNEEKFNMMSKKARHHILQYDNTLIKEKLISIYKDNLGFEISLNR